MDDDTPVVEGTVEETVPTTTDDTTAAPGAVNSGQVLVNMEGMIKNYIASIGKMQLEAKQLKEMLDDIFSNDPTYQQHNDAAKEATKVKQQTKGEILKRPQAKELNEKIKTIKSELKENQAALSDYLQEWARMSGQTELEDDNGELLSIVYNAKLVRKSLKL